MEYIELRNKFEKPLVITGLLRSGKKIVLRPHEECRYHYSEYKYLFETVSLKLYNVCDIKRSDERRKCCYMWNKKDIETGSIAIFHCEK